MTVIYYVLPVVVIVLVLVVSRLGQKRALASVQNMTPEQARERINQYFAGSFALEPGETLWACWVGEDFQGERSGAGQVAGAALNQLSKAAIGVSTYVPQVQVAITSRGRVLVAREYSELGERGNFRQVAALGRGTQALDAATARPGAEPQPPLANPMQRSAPPEFIQFRSPQDEACEAWMHAGQVGSEGFVAAFQAIVATIPAPASG